MIINILLAFTLILFFLVSFAWVIARRIVIQPRELFPEEWKKYNLHPENISFQTSDGLKLAGVFIRGTKRASIILLHGYGRSKEQMLPQARFLNQAGYNVFMFDFRASGESEGNYITFGQNEQRDLVGAVRYLKTRSDVDSHQIGLLGFSMGGATALMTSNDLPEIRAIVVCSSFARFKSVIWQNFKEYFKGLPFFPLGWIVLYLIKLRTGIYYPRINPITYIHKLKARPLMVIHGTHDQKVSVRDAMEIHKQAPWLKEFWIVQNAGHDNLYEFSKEEYEHRVLSFFQQYIS